MRFVGVVLFAFFIGVLVFVPHADSGYATLPKMAEAPEVTAVERAVSAFAASWTTTITTTKHTTTKPTTITPLTPVDPNDTAIKHSPSLTPSQIDSILTSYGSPAVGTGQTFYNEGIKHGIDPAWAVAFFIHESSAGTAGAAVDTKNMGNIICTPGYTCIDRFRSYATWEEGIADWYTLIDTEYVGGRGLTSINDVIPIYAPSFENDIGGYQNVVTATVAGWRRASTPVIAGTRTTILSSMPKPSAQYNDWNCAYWDWQRNGSDCRHYGTDYPASAGTVVRVTDHCLFINSVDVSDYGGGFVRCTLPTGDLYLGHLQNIRRFTQGDVLPAGTIVGEVGGPYPQTSGPHVHVQLTVKGKIVDWEQT